MKKEVTEIIDYLNYRCKTKFRYDTRSTVKLIEALLNAEYTLADFKTVIDKKYSDWHGTDYEKFLRPSTLFRRTNFENYLNEKKCSKKQREVAEIEQFLWGK